MHKQHDTIHGNMGDVICNAYACSGRKNDEQGINLANQVCRWKDEMISVEIDIRITRNGCTVCKWQARHEWHKAAINSTMLLSMQQETMLQHPNIKTKHMAEIYRRCLTKEEHWAMAKSYHNRFKQAWQKSKKYQVGHGINSITKQCSEQVINMLQELIIAKQGMAWIYSKHRSKVPYWP